MKALNFVIDTLLVLLIAGCIISSVAYIYTEEAVGFVSFDTLRSLDSSIVIGSLMAAFLLAGLGSKQDVVFLIKLAGFSVVCGVVAKFVIELDGEDFKLLCEGLMIGAIGTLSVLPAIYAWSKVNKSR